MVASFPSFGEGPEWRSLSSSLCLTLGPTGAVSLVIDGVGSSLGSIGAVLGWVAGLVSSARFVRTAMETGSGLVLRFETPWAAIASVLAMVIVVNPLASLLTVHRVTDHPTAEDPDA